MKLAIVGSRTCPQIDIEKYLDETPDTIISGGAIGADTLAHEYALKKGIKFIELKPDYKSHGKIAPLVRNRLIVDECDSVLAFWDGKSKGTKFVIDYATKMNKPVKTVYIR